MRTNDGIQRRLREIESELIEIATRASMPAEKDYCEALIHAVRRLERIAIQNPRPPRKHPNQRTT
jgi:hypothetical protein